MMKIQQVLAHQLTGVTFHADCACLYESQGKRKECKQHYKHYLKECESHLHTRLVLNTGALLDPSDMERIAVENIEDIPRLWKKWEENTLTMYRELVAEEPKRSLWKSLCRDVEKELRCMQTSNLTDGK